MTVRTAVGTENEVSSRLVMVARDVTALEPIRRMLDGTVIHIVHLAETGAGAISFLEVNAVEIVALVDLPPSEGVGIAREMERRWPSLGVVMMGREDRDRIRANLQVHFTDDVADDPVTLSESYLDHVAEDMYQGELFGAILRTAGRPW